MPALLLPSLVLQCKGEDGIALLHCIFSLGVVRLEGAIDGVEGGGRGKGVCLKLAGLLGIEDWKRI